ncbi:hypothetical protein FHS68_001504 [Dyadobacter arcticus]|uniref:Uncharacterized protein n=1 Tax=Dyadobacter arcticus TaxID=1078754 RepID=A0ABX0UIK8_9BACT|nr:hypothetical protein [Dyadobacter arcticus]
MGHEYALDWLDQMVNDLDPLRTEPESLDNYQSISIIDKAEQEEKRLIVLFRQIAFQKWKARQMSSRGNSVYSLPLSKFCRSGSLFKYGPRRSWRPRSSQTSEPRGDEG